MSETVIRLPHLGDAANELWHALLDLAEAVEAPWTLVGGQMVLLHALEHGERPPTLSQDGDVVGDVRSRPEILHAIVAALSAAGFEVDGMSPSGLAHRYVRQGSAGPVKIDVLAPDGLGSRTDLTTTPPGRTIEVPGGTQALSRTERVRVVHQQREASIPRPTLIAAIVGKAAACGLPGDNSRHLRDAALLLALLEDPFEAKDQLSKKDRERLEMAKALADSTHAAWNLVPFAIRDQGIAAFEILRSPPTG